jgi:hypothetical protein
MPQPFEVFDEADGVDGLFDDFEGVTGSTGVFEQVDGTGLAGEQQNRGLCNFATRFSMMSLDPLFAISDAG